MPAEPEGQGEQLPDTIEQLLAEWYSAPLEDPTYVQELAGELREALGLPAAPPAPVQLGLTDQQLAEMGWRPDDPRLPF